MIAFPVARLFDRTKPYSFRNKRDSSGSPRGTSEEAASMCETRSAIGTAMEEQNCSIRLFMVISGGLTVQSWYYFRYADKVVPSVPVDATVRFSCFVLHQQKSTCLFCLRMKFVQRLQSPDIRSSSNHTAAISSRRIPSYTAFRGLRRETQRI